MSTEDYVNQNQSKLAKTRRAPLEDKLVTLLNTIGGQTGIHFTVVSGGQNASTGYTGSTRHDQGGAADVMAYKVGPNGEKQYLDFSTPEGQKAWAQVATLARQNGATGVGAAEGYMGTEEMHIGYQGQVRRDANGNVIKNPSSFKGVWGKDGKAALAPAWLKTAWDAGSHPTPPVDIPTQVAAAHPVAPNVPPAVAYQNPAPVAPGAAAIDTAAGAPGKLVTIPPTVPPAVVRPGVGGVRDVPVAQVPTLDAGGAAGGAQPVRGNVQVAPTTAFNGSQATAVGNGQPGNSGVIKTVPQVGNVGLPAGVRPNVPNMGTTTAFDGAAAAALLAATRKPTGSATRDTTAAHPANVQTRPVGSDVMDSHGAPANVQQPTNALNVAPVVTAAAPAGPTYDPSVKALQSFLGITADGLAGPQTIHAVEVFQNAHGLKVDGIVGPQTLAALNGAAAVKPVVAPVPMPAPVVQPVAASNNKPSTNALNTGPAVGTPVQLASGTVSTVGATGSAQGGAYQYVVQPDGSVLNTTTGQISAPPGMAYSKGSNMNGDNGVPGNSGNWFNQVTGRA